MADKPINLNTFRKAKARAEKEQRAAENRAKHGRTKIQKSIDRAREEAKAAKLKSSKRDKSEEE